MGVERVVLTPGCCCSVLGKKSETLFTWEELTVFFSMCRRCRSGTSCRGFGFEIGGFWCISSLLILVSSQVWAKASIPLWNASPFPCRESPSWASRCWSLRTRCLKAQNCSGARVDAAVHWIWSSGLFVGAKRCSASTNWVAIASKHRSLWYLFVCGSDNRR